MDESELGSGFGPFLRENRILVLVVAVGLALMALGVWQFVKPEQPSVEIIKADDVGGEDSAKIFVDVAGAVINPGVYELESGARIGNALVEAGGLSAEADRGWVSRYVNLAAPVVDGAKIYIPIEGENTGGSAGSASVGGGEVAGVGVQGQGININTASASELDALWGIGEARAADIIGNRPYQSIEELMTKAGIPKNVYDRIKDQVSVY